MAYKVGSYDWFVNVEKDDSMSPREWRKYRFDMVKERLDSFDLQKGDKVKIKAGGKNGTTTHIGTISRVDYNIVDGWYIVLAKNKVPSVIIEGWRVIEIVMI